MKVGCLGPEASFSFQAAKNIFKDAEIITCNSITTVFDLVNEGGIDKGIVPLENSTGGSITVTLDELISKNIFIEADYFLKIEHALLSNYKLKDITQIFSHPQAFSQCKNWLRKNAKDKELIEVLSTAKAAEKAAQTDFTGAIASTIAAEKYGLGILENKINDSGQNETRFIIFSKKEVDSFKKEKTSIIFGAKNKPGALLTVLECFKNENINLTKLESRPAIKKDWEYLFFVDFQGNLSEEHVKRAIEKIKTETIEIKILGSYSRIK